MQAGVPVFHSVALFIIVEIDGTDHLVVKVKGKEKLFAEQVVEVPRGTVEVQDCRSGGLSLAAVLHRAALREAFEEVGRPATHSILTLKATERVRQTSFFSSGGELAGQWASRAWFAGQQMRSSLQTLSVPESVFVTT